MSLTKYLKKKPLAKFINETNSHAFNIALTILFLLLLNIPYFKQLNNLFVDQLHGGLEAREEIVIIEIDDTTLSEIGAWPWDRNVFAKALENLDKGDPRVVGIDVLFLEDRAGDAAFEEELKETETPVVFASKLSEDEHLESKFSGENVKSGYSNFVPDADGKIRRATLSTESKDECVNSFSFEVFQEYLGSLSTATCTDEITLRKGFIVKNDLLFNYTKSEFTHLSFADLYNGKIDKSELNDKIILIGSTVTDLKSNLSDNFTDIFGRTTPGIKIHANVINSLLEGRSQAPLSNTLFIPLILLSTICLFLAYKKIRSNVINFLVFVTVLGLTTLIGIVSFEQGVNWPFLQNSTLLSVNYIFAIAYKYFVEHKENRFIKKAFSQYINPELLGKLMENPKNLKLGGEKRELTVLFSDIRGFTSISEKMAPEELVRFTNEYLDQVSKIILDNNGTIDKYIGDAVMAFWNAPLEDKDHRENAINTAMQMQKHVSEFNKQNPQSPELKIGIGINTGKMIVGNIGGRKRFDYTLLGDEVNLGSRVEGLTKKYGVSTIVTESVVKGFNDATKRVLFRQLDEVVVKGRSTPVKLYQPLAKNNRNKRLKSSYEQAFRLYQEGEFEKALRIFETLKKGDAPSMVIYERIPEVRQDKQWNGVWKWSEK